MFVINFLVMLVMMLAVLFMELGVIFVNYCLLALRWTCLMKFA